jgi:predicted transcriptional regulator
MRAIELLRVVLGADLDMSDRVVLSGIIHSISWDTWSGPVSIKQIAVVARLSPATVKRSLASLIKKGLIERERSQTRFGEVSGLIKVHVEKINDFAVAQPEPTLAQHEPTLAQPEPPLAQIDTSMAQPEPPLAQSDTSMAQSDTSMAQSEPPISVLSVLSVEKSVLSVDQSVDRSVDGSVDDAAREPEPDAAPTPAWRTLPERSNGWLFSRAYFNIVKNDLGHDHNGITTITNAIAAAKVYPDRVDIQAFLAQHPHLIH